MTNTETQFIARQPIFDNQETLFAYEVLYRNSNNNYFPEGVSDNEATSRLSFNSMLLHDIKKISNNSLIFINLSTQTLLDKLPKLFDPEKVIIEITERTENLNNVCMAIKELRQKQYKFALDDYDGNKKWDCILQEVDYIKIEVEQPLSNTLLRMKELKNKYPAHKIIVERIEDYESYYQLKQAGCDYFQGYFFAKPEMQQLPTITPAQLVVIELMRLANNQSLNFKLIQKEIEKDISLVTRLLRLVNNAVQTKAEPFTSLYQAIVYVGEDMLRRFIKVMAVSSLSASQPSELLLLSLSRASFISSMLKNKGTQQQESGYFLGLISLLHVILSVDLETTIKELNIHNSYSDALIHQNGEMGSLLILCESIERGNWRSVAEISKTLGVSTKMVQVLYKNSLRYADNTLSIAQAEYA